MLLRRCSGEGCERDGGAEGCEREGGKDLHLQHEGCGQEGLVSVLTFCHLVISKYSSIFVLLCIMTFCVV